MSQYWDKDRIRAFARLLAGKTGFYIIALVLILFAMSTLRTGPVQLYTAEVRIDTATAVRRNHISSRYGAGRKYTLGYHFTDTEGNLYWLEANNPGIREGLRYTLTYTGESGSYLLLGAEQEGRVLLDTNTSLAIYKNDTVFFCILLAASVFLLVLILRGIKKAYQELKLWDYVKNYRE